MKVHEKIRALREEKNWSQEEMAKRLNMSVNGYSKIERGETKAYIPKLEQIAEVFEVDLIELIPQNGNHIYINNSDGSGCNIIGSPAELAFENQKQQLIIELKDKELTMKDREINLLEQKIADQQKIISFLENKLV